MPLGRATFSCGSSLPLLRGMVVRSYWVSIRRTTQIRQFVQRAGLIYIGDALPKSFPRHAFKIVRNAVVGDLKPKEIVLFDWTAGYGRGRFGQTIVAIRPLDGAEFDVAQLTTGLTTSTTRKWTLVYRPKQFLSVAEIEALVDNL